MDILVMFLEPMMSISSGIYGYLIAMNELSKRRQNYFLILIGILFLLTFIFSFAINMTSAIIIIINLVLSALFGMIIGLVVKNYYY